MTVVRDSYAPDLKCPKCGRKLTGSARAVGDRIEIVCLGCHTTVAEIDLEPRDDLEDWD